MWLMMIKKRLRKDITSKTEKFGEVRLDACFFKVLLHTRLRERVFYLYNIMPLDSTGLIDTDGKLNH